MASQGAIIVQARWHARELGDRNTRVNAIAPGLSPSDRMKGNLGLELARTPVIAARLIKHLMFPEDPLGTLIYLASPNSDFVTGQKLYVDVGTVHV